MEIAKFGKIKEGLYKIPVTWGGKIDAPDGSIKMTVKVAKVDKITGMHLELLDDVDLALAFDIDGKVVELCTARTGPYRGGGSGGKEILYSFHTNLMNWLPSTKDQIEFSDRQLTFIVIDLSVAGEKDLKKENTSLGIEI
jgi:hypothetical protein